VRPGERDRESRSRGPREQDRTGAPPDGSHTRGRRSAAGGLGGGVMDAPFNVLGWAKGAADADAAACRRGVGRLAQGEGRGEEGAGDARVFTFDGSEWGTLAARREQAALDPRCS